MAKLSITNALSVCNLRHLFLSLLGTLSLVSAVSASAQTWKKAPALNAPEPAREFRGVWIATVYNIDWPSNSNASPATQKAELIALLDLAQSCNLNAVVLQVRPMSDAIYASSIEPWSKYLTGKNGRPPSPFWDPLTFAVDAAHARGLELHAWFNPFRASVSGVGELAANHITKTHPEVVRQAGSTKWLDPTSPFVRQRALDVIADVVTRYDIDGVHIDDYFYPYPHNGGGEKFDDKANRERYLAGGGKLELADWRREQVNTFIREFYQRIKNTRRWVKVGVSPFGIWRPGVPEGTEARLDAYDHIYADSQKWLHEGWVDYFAPQLYWIIEGPQAFNLLFDWWQSQNVHQRHLWPGISPARIGRKGVRESDGRNATEIANQIDITRGSPAKPSLPEAGHIHWSISALKKNAGGIADRLRTDINPNKALFPASPWLADPDTVLPRTELAVRQDSSNLALAWYLTDGAKLDAHPALRWWCVQVRSGVAWRTVHILPSTARTASVPATVNGEAVTAVAVRAVDRVGNVGPAEVRVPAS